MNHRSALRVLGLVAAVLAVSAILGGCVIRRTRPEAAPVVVTQPAPPPVVVTQPAPTPVVVTAPPAAPQVSSGYISYPYERVRYPLSLSYARTVAIYVDGHGLDPTVSVYNSYGGRIGFDDDSGGSLDSQLTLTLAPGSYVIEVAGYSSSTGPFTLTVQ